MYILVWMVQLLKSMVRINSNLLGKPSYTYIYIYILESTDKDGNTNKPEHIRCRGIPTSCIQYKADQDNITVFEIYKILYKGEVI